jgi:pyruvate formate lyase activating enzyme
MKALIFDIKHFAIHDGPGIRTTVFFKGCPLSCPWCHNPESRSENVEYYEHIDKVGSKSFTTEKSIGKYYSINELMDEVNKDLVFYTESNGGITCSGGEPLAQYDFLGRFLNKCYDQGIHTALDTSGYADMEVFRKIAPVVNLFLFDIKHMENEIHKRYTGVDIDVILKNFDWLIDSGYETIARIPIIPNINADLKNIERLIDYLENRKCDNFNEVHLLPYHHIGCAKYKKFNINGSHGFEEPTDEMMQEYAHLFMESGFKIKIGG